MLEMMTKSGSWWCGGWNGCPGRVMVSAKAVFDHEFTYVGWRRFSYIFLFFTGMFYRMLMRTTGKKLESVVMRHGGILFLRIGANSTEHCDIYL